MPKKILVTGTVAYDHLLSYDATFLENLRNIATLEILSVSFYTHHYAKRLGGTGANMAWNIKLLKRDPLLVSSVGSDGGEYLDVLKTNGIDTRFISVHDNDLTATGMCCTDTRQHQIWFFHRGADTLGQWPDLSAERANIAYAIVGQRHCPAMMDAARWCAANAVPMLFDPGQEIRSLSQEELEEAVNAATGIITNEFEWGLLADRLHCTPEELSQKVDYVIVTEAERGHSIYSGGTKESFGRCDCTVFANPTGAGDSFRAGLLAGLTSGWDLPTSTKLGAALASFVVQEDGARLDTIDLAAVYDRARIAYGHTLPELPGA